MKRARARPCFAVNVTKTDGTLKSCRVGSSGALKCFSLLLLLLLLWLTLLLCPVVVRMPCRKITTRRESFPDRQLSHAAGSGRCSTSCSGPRCCSRLSSSLLVGWPSVAPHSSSLALSSSSSSVSVQPVACSRSYRWRRAHGWGCLWGSLICIKLACRENKYFKG